MVVQQLSGGFACEEPTAHTVDIRAKDNEGGLSPTESRTVTVDTTAPTFTSITATGGSTTVVATFSEAVLCSTVSENDFTATINGTAVTVNPPTCTGTSDATIGVVLASAPASGQTVSITLTGSVTDSAGNAAPTPTTRSAPAA